jgi:hypothetical protein
MRLVVSATAIAIIIGISQPSAAEQLCLTTDEAHDVARMGAVMGFGGGLRRCGNCLGARYQPTVDKYEATGMLVEFRRSEAALERNQTKFDYTDGLVRDTARKLANDVSADCKACESTAAMVSDLASEAARTKLYDGAAEKLTKLSSYKKCP